MAAASTGVEARDIEPGVEGPVRGGIGQGVRGNEKVDQNTGVGQGLLVPGRTANRRTKKAFNAYQREYIRRYRALAKGRQRKPLVSGEGSFQAVEGKETKTSK